MSTRSISWAVVTKSGNLNFLEHSGHLGPVMGLILPYPEHSSPLSSWTGASGVMTWRQDLNRLHEQVKTTLYNLREVFYLICCHFWNYVVLIVNEWFKYGALIEWYCWENISYWQEPCSTTTLSTTGLTSKPQPPWWEWCVKMRHCISHWSLMSYLISFCLSYHVNEKVNDITYTSQLIHVILVSRGLERVSSCATDFENNEWNR